jgi:hypothetical protein
MNKSNQVLLFRPEIDDDNHVLSVMCSDGKERKCKLSLLGAYEQMNLANSLKDAFYSGARVTFKALDNWSADRWFVDIEVEENTDNRCRILYHTKSVLDWHKDLYSKAIKYAGMKYHFKGKGIKMQIAFVDDIPNHKAEVTGLCRIFPSKIKNNEHQYTVFIKEQEFVVDVLDTIFHELRHVQQYVEGVLSHDELWKGQDYEHLPYIDLPYEIDARETAAKMVPKFQEWLKNSSK